MAFDVIAFAAHPDDLEVSMGGAAAKLAAAGQRVLFVDLTDGEPSRYAAPGVRQEQAMRAAEILRQGPSASRFHCGCDCALPV
jgi:LmbE family N-acetylglucosaminyl deacetylase